MVDSFPIWYMSLDCSIGSDAMASLKNVFLGIRCETFDKSSGCRTVSEGMFEQNGGLMFVLSDVREGVEI